MNWGEMAAMLAVLGAISTAVQWVLTRAIIQPMITKSFNELKEWAEQRFPSKTEFDDHKESDEKFQSLMWTRLK